MKHPVTTLQRHRYLLALALTATVSAASGTSPNGFFTFVSMSVPQQDGADINQVPPQVLDTVPLQGNDASRSARVTLSSTGPGIFYVIANYSGDGTHAKSSTAVMELAFYRQKQAGQGNATAGQNDTKELNLVPKLILARMK